MTLFGKIFRCLAVVVLVNTAAPIALFAQSSTPPQDTLGTWYRLTLELVRHTPTYTPPVASRAFAYISVAAYEATASGAPNMKSLAGQLNGLTTLPLRETGAVTASIKRST